MKTVIVLLERTAKESIIFLLRLGLLFAVYSVIWSFLQKFLQVSSFASFAVAFLVVGLLSLAVVLWKHKGIHLCHLIPEWNGRLYLFSIITIGVILRLVWAQIADVHLVSDAHSYFLHAQQLVTEGYYGFPNSHPDSFWPPGYPFVLYPFFILFGINETVVILVNILLFVFTAAGIFYATKEIYGEVAAKVATLAILLWPNFLFLSASGTKEAILCAIFPWLAWLFITSVIRINLWKVVLIGLLVGFSVLTQPSIILIYGVIVLFYALISRKLPATLKLAILMFAAMSITIAPWSIRNYIQLDRFVMVSSNGGDVFYRANNANAKQGFNAASKDSPLSNLSGIEKDRLGYKLGFKWIKENPIDFLQLSVQKTILYFGSDDTSLWQTIDDPENSKKGVFYYVLLMISNGYWVILLLLTFVAVWKKEATRDNYLLLFAGLYLCLLLIDATFEAGARHHIPLYGLIAITIGGLCSNRKEFNKNQYGLAT